MVAKINNGASLFGAVSYNQEKVDKGEAKVIFTHKMIENISGDESRNFHLTLKSFESYLLANRKTEKPIVHISLNPDPADVLSDEQYASLARDYMEKLGFKEQPYIVYKHEDIDRLHVHIVSVRVDETGKKLKDSFEHRKSMDICRELEQEYGLVPVIKREEKFQENFIKKIDYNRGDLKRQVSNILKSLLGLYRFQTLGEYNALLSCFNIKAKEVKGERNGKHFCGLVYSVTNDKGEEIGNPLKSSLFGKSAGHQAIGKIMQQSAETLKNTSILEQTRGIVSEAMKKPAMMDDFLSQLRAKGMDVVFRQNDTGRIYGVTFIDHQNRVVLNGSRLGKTYSANVFNELFSTKEKESFQLKPKQEIQLSRKPVLEDKVKKQEYSPVKDLGNVAGALFNMLPQNEDNYEEYPRFPKPKKKKKKRRISR